MASIGILGGMGPQASNKLYELIISKTAGYTNAAVDEDYPEIVLLNVPVPNFITNKTRMSEARDMLIERTKLLEKAGCTINGIACNTVHLLLPDLQAVTKVPFVSLPELVAQKVYDAGYRRVGLLATPTTLASALYDEAVKTAVLIRPDGEFADAVEVVIYKQLSNKLTETEKDEFQQRVQNFMLLEKLDAVILGCTELPLVYGDNENLRILNTLDILADALLQEYFLN